MIQPVERIMRIKGIFLGLSVAVFLVFILKIHGIYFNYTSSMPIGFYRLVSTHQIQRGDLVSVCLLREVVREGLKRGYLTHGFCSNHSVPVFKEVVAIPGDELRLTSKALVVNGISYDAPQANRDHHGFPMKKFIAQGSYRLTKYWLYGRHDPKNSWDSRYFGGVSRRMIQGKYQSLLVWSY